MALELIGLNSWSWEYMRDNRILDKVFAEESIVERSEAICTLRDRCKVIGKAKDFDYLVKAYERQEKAQRKVQVANGNATNQTAFDIAGLEEKGYRNLNCGAWNADESGIWMPTLDPQVRKEACKHPLLIVSRYQNLQTDEERVKLAYKRNGKWHEITVAKSIIANASKIVQLSDFGILVSSESSRNMVKYLADLEAYSEQDIPVTRSTTKLGWHNEGKDFIPFDLKDIQFDGEKQFGHIYNAIASKGSKSAWMDEVKAIRKRGRTETKIMLAASLAAPLIEKLGILPFFVDLYGMTEGGKTVALMLAASVWANPDGGAYIGDFMCTDTNLEVKADMLNNLPVLLDDSAKSDKRITDNFEAVIYNLCSGRGKGRSNRELGLNRTYTWKTDFICNGETPLTDHMGKGGALNRIIEVPANDHIFENPARSAELFKQSYGWLGPAFIEALKGIPSECLKGEFDEIVELLRDPSKMQKQTQSMACMMLADRISERLLFKDGCLIGVDEAKKLIINVDQVSDNQRCYKYIIGMIEANPFRFKTPDSDKSENFERWGILREKENEVVFLPAMLEKICTEAKYSYNSFIDWAFKKELLDCTKGRRTKKVRIPWMEKSIWANVIKLPNDTDDEPEDERQTEFLPLPPDDEVPFK